MQKHHNRNNAQSIFSAHQILSTSQIGKLLDSVATKTLHPMLAKADEKLYALGGLKLFIKIGGTLQVALDGTGSFSTKKISCPCGSWQTLKNGTTLYRHTAATPVIVTPGQRQNVGWQLGAGITRPGALSYWAMTFIVTRLFVRREGKQMEFLFACKPDSHTLPSEKVLSGGSL